MLLDTKIQSWMSLCSPNRVSVRLLKSEILPGSQSSPNVVNPDSSLQLDEIKVGEWYEGTVVSLVSSFCDLQALNIC